MYLGIDIGGTKTLIALFSTTGKIMKRLKFPTAKDPEKFARDLARELKNFFPAKKSRTPSLRSVTISIAAVVDRDYSVATHPKSGLLPTTFGKPLKYGNLPWQGFDFTASMENCIKNLFSSNRVKLADSAPLLSIHGDTRSCCPIYIENDANLATLFEAGKFKGKSIYLTFSTGIGGGIIKNGVISDKSDSFEPGHNKYTWRSQRLEYEDIASAEALKAAYGVQATDIAGRAGFQDIALRVSTGLSDIIRSERPDRIIVGGALGFRLRYFKKYLTPVLAVSLNCPQSSLPDIIPAKYPLESAIYGCFTYGSKRD